MLKKLGWSLIVAALAVCCAIHPEVCFAADDAPVMVYQNVYNFGSRDAVYSAVPVGNGKMIMTGPSTSTAAVNNTGTDFFAFCLNSEDGTPCQGFGDNGLVRVDFDNVNGSSRTDVATELVYVPPSDTNCPNGCVALLGEAVVSKEGSPLNLTFAIAMLDASTGELIAHFGQGGKALYDIDKGANDEIFFGAMAFETLDGSQQQQPVMYVGGFANPTNTTGAAPSFNCAVLKISAITGERITQWGQNGQVIIDYNGYDERCRSGLFAFNNDQRAWNFYALGRSRPAAQSNDASDANNFRATIAKLDLDSGAFDASFGSAETPFGLGRSLVNLNNGSFDLIKSIQTFTRGSKSNLISLGNWGGWDNGVSGNKAVGLIRWNLNEGGLLPFPAYCGGQGNSNLCKKIAFLPPSANGGQSFDVHALAEEPRSGDLIIVGGVKSTAAASSAPRAVLIRYRANDSSFSVHEQPLPDGAVSSLYRSIVIRNKYAFVAGEAGFGAGQFDALAAKFLL